ncbi:S-layer homology domain-containing protein [Paenibacillus sp. UMB4589-SE434]|uniref:S-layer homology domain-containing protein n=1 Tax=Paenibacillus sp. UMB4589-SE434 TaxID=3046314 RepID=UPI00255028D7|nr:S-layer homology domain-containing protein [Paenibacillus sp. UMB4589-SE434]MDK8182362.1 S-layer homology domain-containing protein [Paenibacillus sp. UMB4589-SE434]
MNKQHYKIALAAAVSVILANVSMGGSVSAESKWLVGASSAVTAVQNTSDKATSEAAIAVLVKQGVLSGYSDGTMKPQQNVKRAELAKMVVLALQVDGKQAERIPLNDVQPQHWFANYVHTLVDQEIMPSNEGQFKPYEHVTQAQLVQIIAKALQRDALSVQSWIKSTFTANQPATRADTSQLLVSAQKSIRSETAKITKLRSLNKVTMEATFDQPLTLADESLDAGLKHFIFNNGLELVNQPRLKSGSFATYILPTKTQVPGTTYTLTYKNDQKLTVEASAELIRMNMARQVDRDSFELEALKADGVADYGYLISAYAGGRGANAFILNDNNELNGQPFQIISSLRSRSVTITPEGGQAMVASYLPFTQSTDGKQEPKFRLPNGAQFKPGVKYTVTSDWLTVKNASFVAESAAQVKLDAAAQVDAATVAVTLQEDPADEIFVLREVKLTGSDGSEAKAQYVLQSRKGATGTFELQNNAKLTAGVTYTVQPLEDWAIAAEVVTFTAK